MTVKIGILSMQRICNYGSFLQAYGLKKILEELACDVQFVDYYPGECLIHNEEGTGISRKISKVKDVIAIKAPLIDRIRFINYKINYAKKYYQYLGIDDSLHYAPDVDVVVIGSDEVFNCVQDNPNVGFTPDLFGVGQTAPKVISYAASFGNTTLKKLERYQVKEKVADWLCALNTVSVRDANSGRIVRNLIGTEPYYHLDPVLIYDFVEKRKDIPKEVPERAYIIVYGYSGRFSDSECKQIRQYADSRKLKILCIGGIQHCCDKFVDCNPFEVIAYFKNAQAVVTDTFHGTILSVITHRRFVSLVRKTGYGNAEKLTDLLDRLQLTDRILSDMSKLDDLLSTPVDYIKTDKIIETERQRTYHYLQQHVK